MKNTRFIQLFVAAGLLLGSQSCKDLLTEIPIARVGTIYINSKEGVEDAVKATYGTLRDYYGREDAMTLSIFGTDTYREGADGSFKIANQYNSAMDGRFGPSNNIWVSFYRGINTANAVIGRIETVPGFDDNTKKRRIAEMKFLRAHHYFILVQMFGGVALTTKETLEPTKAVTRASVKDVYAQIISDLESSLTDLGIATSDYGRATKGAAEHLLAKVYITKATSEASAADDFVKAGTYAQNVIKNYNYALLPDFASVFLQGAGEISSEVIFATQYTSDILTNGVGNQTHLYFGMEYDTQAGMVRDIANGRPFKRFRPTDYLLNVVFAEKDRVNDSRYKKTFKDTWFSNRPGTFSNVFDNSKTSVTFASGDTAIFIPGFEMPMAERAKKKYQVLVPSLYRPNLFPTLQKFFDPLRPNIAYEQGSRDFIMFRLADTYLLAAEALIKQGKPAEAVPLINAVRRRAAWPGKQAAMEITAAQATMDFIYEEREREMLAEMHRWFDLKRWGILVDRVQKYNPDGAPNIKAHHVLRPIPQDQIDRTEGGATAFPQNPGY